MKKTLITLLISLSLGNLSTSHAITLEGLSDTEKGLAISQEIDKRDNGFGSFTANMTMVLKNKKGQESTRQIRNKTLEVQGDGDKSMSIFDEPADVKGTASLTYSHGLKPDDQWLYLPALKRIKRINSKNKSGPFLGSEFAFEDIGSQEVEKYTYKYLRDEIYNERDSYVVERYPSYKHSGYTRQIVWVDKERFIPLKIDFYDRKNSLLKRLQFKDYHQYLEKHWRAHEMFMENFQTIKSTVLFWKNFNFSTDLSDRDFDKNSLKRAR